MNNQLPVVPANAGIHLTSYEAKQRPDNVVIFICNFVF
jgi:hypothetical protein